MEEKSEVKKSVFFSVIEDQSEVNYNIHKLINSFGTEHRKSHIIPWRNSIATLLYYGKFPLMAQPWNKAKAVYCWPSSTLP